MNIQKLTLASLNVCGIKRRLCYPDFLDLINDFDIMCLVDTKLDDTDVISVPGYSMISQHRQQTFIRKSGGIAVLFKNKFKHTIYQIKMNCDYILWVKLDKLIFNTDEDVLLGILYIPPTQSRFLNDDEYLTLETEITSMCSQSKYVCLTGECTDREFVRLCNRRLVYRRFVRF